jgi:hypothetical protein
MEDGEDWKDDYSKREALEGRLEKGNKLIVGSIWYVGRERSGVKGVLERSLGKVSLFLMWWSS